MTESDRSFEFTSPGRDRRRLEILRAVRRAPTGSQHSYARELETSVGMVHRHLHEMMEEGLVRTIGSTSRTRRYQLTNDGKAELDRLGDGLRFNRMETTGELIDDLVESLRTWLGTSGTGDTGAIVYGAGLSGGILQLALDAVPITCFAILDPDPANHGTRVLGVPVHAPAWLATQRFTRCALIGLGLDAAREAELRALAAEHGLEPLVY